MNCYHKTFANADEVRAWLAENVSPAAARRVGVEPHPQHPDDEFWVLIPGTLSGNTISNICDALSGTNAHEWA